MSALLKSLLTLWLGTVTLNYQLHPDAIKAKKSELSFEMTKRFIVRNTIKGLEVATVASQVWWVFSLIYSADTTNADARNSSVPEKKFVNPLTSRAVWGKVGLFGAQVFGLYLIQCALERLQHLLRVHETVDWCLQAFAPYGRTIAQLRSYNQSPASEYRDTMIKKDLKLLCGQLEYLIAFMQEKSSRTGISLYRRIADYLCKEVNERLKSFTLGRCSLDQLLDELEILVDREVNQLRVMHEKKKEYTLNKII